MGQLFFNYKPFWLICGLKQVDKLKFLRYDFEMKILKVVCLLTMVSVFLFPLASYAQIFLPFGGKIVYKEFCPCSGNWLISYIPVKETMPKLLTYRPGISTMYEYRTLEPGMEILGLTATPDVCLTIIFCIPHPLQATLGVPFLIKMVGTSGIGHTTTNPNAPNSSTSGNGTNNNSNNPANNNNASSTSPQGCPGQSDDVLGQRYTIANEGWRNSSYADPSGDGTRDIGVGHQITGNEPFSTNGQISDAQVEQLFQADYAQHQREVMNYAQTRGIDWESLSPERQAVLTDMNFSMGINRLSGFDRMWDGVEAGDWQRAGSEITNSDYGRAAATEGRAIRNAAVMSSGRPNMMNERINHDPRALNYCA
jgi:GH24 family phage-related lysozyme (muramidase)